jgi:hypothetical protein
MNDSQLKERIFRYFQNEKEINEKIFFKLALLIFEYESNNTDVAVLVDLLKNFDEVLKLIEYFNGKEIKTITLKQFQENLLLTLSFYLKEIKGYDWNYIKQVLELNKRTEFENFNPIVLSKKIQKIKIKMRNELSTLKNITWDSQQIQDFMNNIGETINE